MKLKTRFILLVPDINLFSKKSKLHDNGFRRLKNRIKNIQAEYEFIQADVKAIGAYCMM